MPVTRYWFKDAAAAFFEMPTADAKRLLPAHLQPLEVQHDRSILSLTAFDFSDSMVGPYQEIVLSVIVPPLVRPATDLPKAAFYPFLLGTSTEESREHAIERWHLPHYMRNVVVDMDVTDGTMSIHVWDNSTPILDYVVTEHDFEPVNHLYQSFMWDETGSYKVDIHMEGAHSEHEEERGSLTLYDHPMTEGLTKDEVSTYPFREQWMKNGVQTFEELEEL